MPILKQYLLDTEISSARMKSNHKHLCIFIKHVAYLNIQLALVLSSWCCETETDNEKKYNVFG